MKQGDALSPLLFSFAAQENQEGLKLNGTHQLWAYADGINVLGEKKIPYRKTQMLC
jgi:hypothetical protein